MGQESWTVLLISLSHNTDSFFGSQEDKELFSGLFWQAALECYFGKDTRYTWMLIHSEHIWRWTVSISQSRLYLLLSKHIWQRFSVYFKGKEGSYIFETRNKLAQTQNFFLNFKHFIYEGILINCNSFQGFGSVTETGRMKTTDRNCLLAPVRSPKEKWSSLRRFLCHNSWHEY